MPKRERIKYNELNEPGTAILGDRLVVRRGKTYTTKEDLKLYPAWITLEEAPE